MACANNDIIKINTNHEYLPKYSLANDKKYHSIYNKQVIIKKKTILNFTALYELKPCVRKFRSTFLNLMFNEQLIIHNTY